MLTDTLLTEIDKQHTKIAEHYHLDRRSHALRDFYETVFPTGVRHLMLAHLQDRIDRIRDPKDSGNHLDFAINPKLPIEERKIMPKILENISGLSGGVVYCIMSTVALPYFKKDPKDGPIRSPYFFKLYANSATYNVLCTAEQVSEKFRFDGDKRDKIAYEEDINQYYLPLINESIGEIAQAIANGKFRGQDGYKALDLEKRTMGYFNFLHTN